jgi:glycosyltransferase involved in cell wall biosynthesis
MGGLPEVNIDGVTGFLNDVGDVQKMSENAISLLSDEDKLDQFKINARRESQKFDIQKIVPQYEVLYENLLKKVRISPEVGKEISFKSE